MVVRRFFRPTARSANFNLLLCLATMRQSRNKIPSGRFFGRSVGTFGCTEISDRPPASHRIPSATLSLCSCAPPPTPANAAGRAGSEGNVQSPSISPVASDTDCNGVKRRHTAVRRIARCAPLRGLCRFDDAMQITPNK